MLGVVVLVMGVLQMGEAEVFTAVAEIQDMLQVSSSYLQAVDTYLQMEFQRLDTLRQNMEDLKHVSGLIQSKFDNSTGSILWHPTDLYNFITSWSAVSNTMASNASLVAYSKKRQGLSIPEMTTEDSIGAMQAILRLQKVYRVPTASMSQGLVLGEKGMAIEPDDCVNIAMAARNMYQQGLRSQWLEQAFKHGPQALTYPGSAAYQLAIISNKIGDYEKAAHFMDIAVKSDPSNDDYKGYRMRSKQNNQTMYKTANGVPKLTAEEFILKQRDYTSYEPLCRGDKLPFHDPKQLRLLHCRVHYLTGPYEYYNVEYLSLDPMIALYHNITNQMEADKFMAQAKPNLHRATVVRQKGMPADSRISKVAWLFDGTPMVKSLTKRVERITGLHAHFDQHFAAAEAYQVVNYGIGGQYEPHMDAFGEEKAVSVSPIYAKKSGDRVATFLLYLTDIPAGGATIFSNINITVPPIKFAGALWYNLYRDGSLDLRTKHAGCPVLLGEKWVMNKWMRVNEQFLRRPCGLKPHSYDQYYQSFLKSHPIVKRHLPNLYVSNNK